MGAGNTVSHSALPLRAYNLIWQEWFRDENLQNAVTLDTGNGPDTVTNYTLLRRGKRHDYFTGALPWPQKGSTAVSLPLGTSAPVTRVSNAGAWYSYDMGTNTPTGAGALSVAAAGRVERATGVSFDPNGGLIADLSAATAATINQLRQSFPDSKTT